MKKGQNDKKPINYKYKTNNKHLLEIKIWKNYEQLINISQVDVKEQTVQGENCGELRIALNLRQLILKNTSTKQIQL